MFPEKEREMRLQRPENVLDSCPRVLSLQKRL